MRKEREVITEPEYKERIYQHFKKRLGSKPEEECFYRGSARASFDCQREIEGTDDVSKWEDTPEEVVDEELSSWGR